ncbi:MAG TPA: replicative DNA helicase [Planctomycetes bacterium]|nr:replicative DNA helicase [Planctomycetota bacterium]
MTMTTDVLEKKPPQNLEAETCVLGSILIDNDAVGLVSELLQPGDFYDSAHRAIYEAIVALYDDNRAVDVVTVKDRLRSQGQLDEMGGVETLMRVVDSVPNSAHALDYATIVKDRSNRRRLISISTDVLRRAYGHEATSDELLEFVEREIFHLAENSSSHEPQVIGRVLHGTVKMVEENAKTRGRITGCGTDFYDLDDKTGGFQGGDLVILAARPSVGKTTFAINCALNMALRHGKSVAFFSLEMSKEQIAANMLCALAEVKSNHLRRGNLSESEWNKILDAAGRLHELSIFIDDTPGLSPTVLRGKARRLKRKNQIDCIIIDYLQLMEAPSAENRQQQISTISRGLKALARDLSVPIISLSQINRAAEKEDRRPRMSDLRESGAIEQDADLIMFLHDPAYQKGDEGSEAPNGAREVELILAKQRNGPTGKISLQFARDIMKFRSLARDY